MACATPAERFDAEARELGFSRRLVTGEDFGHALYHRPPLPQEVSAAAGGSGGGLLHVYLGGDGSPRQAVRTGPPDPTAVPSVALRLMARDPAPSVFLGRPCYHGVGVCDPVHWTTGRYGEPVVRSLVAALRTLPEARNAPGIVLVGFSGGGTLAMLVAERVPEVRAVVTVAGNLDPDAWTARHGYTPLSRSLNPARRPPLPARVRQLHLRGGRDRRVPPELTEVAIERQPGARGPVYADFDHRCCWASIWPGVLEAVEQAGARGP